MSHFNFKSLAFYGVAISAVLLLFKAVTAYGEANLKAPVAISGRYRLFFPQNLPNCLKSTDLVLNIEQSGIYLNATLLPVDSNSQKSSSTAAKPVLTGLLHNQQLDLSGIVPTSFCNSSVAQTELTHQFQDNSANRVQIYSKIEGENLEGEINLSSLPEIIRFTAQQSAPIQPATNSTSH